MTARKLLPPKIQPTDRPSAACSVRLVGQFPSCEPVLYKPTWAEPERLPTAAITIAWAARARLTLPDAEGRYEPAGVLGGTTRSIQDRASP